MTTLGERDSATRLPCLQLAQSSIIQSGSVCEWAGFHFDAAGRTSSSRERPLMATTSIADFRGRDNVSLAPGIRGAEASDFLASLCRSYGSMPACQILPKIFKILSDSRL